VPACVVVRRYGVVVLSAPGVAADMSVAGPPMVVTVVEPQLLLLYSV